MSVFFAWYARHARVRAMRPHLVLKCAKCCGIDPSWVCMRAARLQNASFQVRLQCKSFLRAETYKYVCFFGFVCVQRACSSNAPALSAEMRQMLAELTHMILGLYARSALAKCIV